MTMENTLPRLLRGHQASSIFGKSSVKPRVMTPRVHRLELPHGPRFDIDYITAIKLAATERNEQSVSLKVVQQFAATGLSDDLFMYGKKIIDAELAAAATDEYLNVADALQILNAGKKEFRQLINTHGLDIRFQEQPNATLIGLEGLRAALDWREPEL